MLPIFSAEIFVDEVNEEGENLGHDIGREERRGDIGEGHDGNRVQKQQVVAALVAQLERRHEDHDHDDGDVSLHDVRDQV